MTFPLCDLDIALAPSFVSEVDEAIHVGRNELTLFYALSTHHGLFVVKDYLRIRAREAANAGWAVRVVDENMTESALVDALDACRPGDRVFLSELDPREGNYAHAVEVATWFVQKGAAVFAAIHGADEERAEARFQSVWEQAVAQGRVGRPARKHLPGRRFIAYEGQCHEVPVRQAGRPAERMKNSRRE